LDTQRSQRGIVPARCGAFPLVTGRGAARYGAVVTLAGPIVSAPLVWVELISSDARAAAAFYGALLGWKPSRDAGTADMVVYLDVARMAGPICGIRPRSPADPRPIGLVGPAPDQWSVRIAPPRPPLAADPGGDQLLRPRAPGPRLGRWGIPKALCYAELRTPDVAGARAWMERRLDAVFSEGASGTKTGLGTATLESSVNLGQPVASIVAEADPAVAGWYPCVQVADLDQVAAASLHAGAQSVVPRELPEGATGTAAAVLTDPRGARLILIEHGPIHGRR
jgi:predicted enzyme related to lactoylglutathione lyase